MWVVTAFDLPVGDAVSRKAYTKFRNQILRYGFTALQKSVYVKHCSSNSRKNTLVRHVSDILPLQGDVMILSMSDELFKRQHFYHDASESAPPEQPEQFLVFD